MRKLALKLTDKLISMGFDKSKYNIYAYGLESILNNLSIIALIIIGGIILGKFPHTLVFLLSWYPLRMLVGGMHAKSHRVCMIVSVTLSLVAIVLADVINKLPEVCIYIALAASYVIVFLRAPVIHKNHPMSDRQQHKMRIAARILMTVECVVIILLMILKSEYAGAAFMGCFITSVLSLVG